MRKYISKSYPILVGFLSLICLCSFGQDQKVADSLAHIYQANTAKGVIKLDLLRNLSFNEVNDLKKALSYADELIKLSQQTGNNLYLHRGYSQRGNKKRLMGNLDAAMEDYFKSATFARKANFIPGEGTSYAAIADIYSITDNHKNAMLYYNKAIATLQQSTDSISLASAISNAGDELLNHKNYGAALVYFKRSGVIFDKVNYLVGKAYNLGNIGMVYANIGKNNLAEKNINEAIQLLEEVKDFYPICVYLLSMSDIYVEKGDKSSALLYATKSLKLAQRYGLKQQISDAYLKLSQVHEKTGSSVESLENYKRYIVYRDSVNNVKATQKIADLRTDFEISQKQIEVDFLNQEKKNQRTVLIALVIILGLLAILLAFIVYGYTQKQKANTVLQRQKEEINQKSLLLEHSLTELRLTQTQLIQKEKMASLGELTAGIAHEIQNPLNFVTNFSEVSIDLIGELREEESRSERDADLIEELLTDLTQNLQKISQYGKRASAIVKGMVEHSRSRAGEKRHINLNALADEYLKMAYHGMCAKDINFTAELNTVFSAELSKLEVMPQEIGRVLLNLYNNAFYSLQQKRQMALHGYQPRITVTTSQHEGYIQIRVSDNGLGIAESIKDKIFQPFFTTKPSGEGTGLGLSLSYDVITKGHQGSLTVNSEEGQGAEFIIELPVESATSPS